MSLIPLMFDYNPWEMHRSCYNHNDLDLFGLRGSQCPRRDLIAWPRWSDLARSAAAASEFNPALIGKDGNFQVSIDVQQFKPNEISVKTVDNNIVVEGKHEEREDEHGYIYRHFVRKYNLPQGYNANDVASELSSDGVLTIKAPKPKELEKRNERVIQIQETGPARESIKDKSEKKAEKK